MAIASESEVQEPAERTAVAQSVLEAIKQGVWDYEPTTPEQETAEPTAAMPGSQEKVSVLAERVRQGLPLWHPSDRKTYRDNDAEV